MTSLTRSAALECRQQRLWVDALNAVDSLGLAPDLTNVGSRLGVVVTEFDDREHEIGVMKADRMLSRKRKFARETL